MIPSKRRGQGMILLLLTIILSLGSMGQIPSAPTNLTVLSNESPEPAAGFMLNGSGGAIYNLDINATTQNYRWKGYVGNISGTLALQDGSGNSLFDWGVTDVTGEVYATRNDSTLLWEDIGCVTEGIIAKEQERLSIINADVDSINKTFAETVHREFYVGITQIQQDSCRSVSLNVNSTQQSEAFQEILLTDGNSLVYASLLENGTHGYNNQTYDFQMILAENAAEGPQPSTAYYFYVELI